MQTTQNTIAQKGVIPTASPVETLLANGEEVIITLTEFFTSDEYDEAPSSVELTFTPQSVWALRKAAETIERNPVFDSISINTFDWNVDEYYDGKARYGKLVLVRAGQSFDIDFSFINDWADTRFSAYLDHQDVQALLRAPMKAL